MSVMNFLSLVAPAPSSGPNNGDFSGLIIRILVILVLAKALGEVAERFKWPALVGELIGGILLGASFFNYIDPHDPYLHILAELGILLLLFQTGLESDPDALFKVGGKAAAVAIAGMALPFLGGLLYMRLSGAGWNSSLFVASALTATSIGITARVLGDLRKLQTDEARIILGAAVLDDILGLVVLSVVVGVVEGNAPSVLGVGWMILVGLSFPFLALVVGRMVAPRVIPLMDRLRVRGVDVAVALATMFALSALAGAVGSALIVGAFSAGLILSKTEKKHEFETRLTPIGDFLIPIFFVTVGASVNLHEFDGRALGVGAILIAIGLAGKYLAGFAAWGKGLRRPVIGVGMIPRGEVGLIFARIGLAAAVLTDPLYAAVVLMVVVSTLAAPPLLKRLLAR